MIKGKVLDDAKNPISYASLSLLMASDSTLVKGNISDESGSFIIEAVKPGSYKLFASYLGFSDVYTEAFTLNEDNKQVMVDITMQEGSVTLNEVVVTAKRPFLEQKADRLLVNVANSAVAAGATALEILQKVPGIIIVQDKVTLAGSQNVQIYIDGKASPYTNMNAVLRDMPSDQIERIELIKQPGAQFDAAGGPIVNLVLKRNINLGFKANAALTLAGFRYDQRDVNGGDKNYTRFNPSISATYRKGKWNAVSSFSYNEGTYFNAIIVDRFIGSEIYSGKNLDNSKYGYGTGRLNVDHYLSEKATIGGAFRLWARTGSGLSNNITSVYNTNEVFLNSFTTINNSNSDRSGLYSNLYYKYEFDSKAGKYINFDFDYNRFNTNNINDLAISQGVELTNRSLSQQRLRQPVNLYVAKVDYKHPLDSNFVFETGLKTSIARVDNQLTFTRGGELSVGESNDFLYDENINAAYTNLNKTGKKIDLNVGLRLEQTVVGGISMGKKVLSRNYVQLFPSASVLYKLNDHMAVQSSYSKRVNRPSFSQQNPFNYFIDSLTYTRGNPNLKPEITNTTQLNLTFDNQPFVGVAYYRTGDVIIENAPKLEGTRTFTTAENLANQSRWEIQLNFPLNIGKRISGFGGNQAIYNSYDATYLGTQYKTGKWNWLAYWQVNVDLSKSFKFETGGFYMTRFLEEFLVIDGISGVNFGLSKTFAEKNGKVSLSFSDAFYKNKTNAFIEFSNIKVNFFQRQYSRNLRLTVSYQFGNTKVKSSSRNAASEAESSRVQID